MKRLAALLVLCAALVGCMPAVESTVPTPTTPLTYGWVMVHDWHAWGVQIGPKVDGSGTHVAVYAWRDCAAAYTPCAWWSFAEYDELVPGSPHVYALTWYVDGWHATMDGRTIAVVNVGSSHGVIEVNYGERTSS